MDGQTYGNIHTWIHTWTMDAETEPPGSGELHGDRYTDGGMTMHMYNTYTYEDSEENRTTVPTYGTSHSFFWFSYSYLNKDAQTN